MNRVQRARGINQIMTGVFYLIAVFFFTLLIGFASYVIIKGFTGATPEMFAFARKGSIGNQLFNTIYLVFISLLFSIPLGVTAGIYLAMYAKKGFLTKFLRICIETLSSLPSIVVGLFGYLVFLVFFGLGKSLLAGHCPFPFWQFRLSQQRQKTRSMVCRDIICRQVLDLEQQDGSPFIMC